MGGDGQTRRITNQAAPTATCHSAGDPLKLSHYCRVDVKPDMRCTDNVTSRSVRETIIEVEKTICITYSECVFVASGIQHAMRMAKLMKFN